MFEYGERSGKLLAYLAHLDAHPPVVVSLTDPQGNDITDLQQVAEEFGKFYRTLYTSRVTHTPQETRDYLAGVKFPKLTKDQLDLLDAPITKEDISEAISCLAASKAPGSMAYHSNSMPPTLKF